MPREKPPPPPTLSEVTLLLQRAAAGEGAADEELLRVVYDELRQLARSRMAQERPGRTLQPTALVNEAYLRLLGQDGALHFENRRHFFGAAGEAMRRILIDQARNASRQKRGGKQARVELEDAEAARPIPARSEELVALDEALQHLETRDPAMAAVVKLRHFVGMTVAETAAALEVSERTVNRQWLMANAWLKRELAR